MKKRSKAFLQLMRPANIVTSVADVLAGIAISGYVSDLHMFNLPPILLLTLSTIGLYGGGVVFNDVFDAELDKTERPERPIPRGDVSIKQGAFLGALLFLAGLVAASFVNLVATLLSFSIVIAALFYDRWSKHDAIAGPLNMGFCRGLNLLLGISIVSSSVAGWWFVAIVPVIYIAAITMISRGEVHGGNKSTLYVAAVFYCIVTGCILFFSWRKQMIWWTLIFLLPFCWIIFSALLRAIRTASPKNIGKAVKAGIIALILMNAAWAAAFGALSLAFLILLLLPFSLWLAKFFAVT